MPDISITLTDADRSNLKAIFDIAVRGGFPDGLPLPHLRLYSIVWPILAKIEQAEVAARNPPTTTTPPPE